MRIMVQGGMDCGYVVVGKEAVLRWGSFVAR